MLEDRSAEHGVVVDKFTDVTSDYSMTSRDYVVRADATAGALTITLPSVADAKGRIYSILARVADAAKTVTIAHKGDSEQWADVVLTMDGEYCMLYSDGMFWHTTKVFAIDGAMAADNVIVRFDGATGKKIQGSSVTIDDTGSPNVPSGQGYKVGNVKVITDQQLAEDDLGVVPTLTGTDGISLTALNTHLGDIGTKINNILAKLRTHGLIAS